MNGTFLCVDMGTTNTRAWLLHDDKVLGRITSPFGVKDVARSGSAFQLHQQLRTLLDTLVAEFAEIAPSPIAILGAGMITSRLGITEIPHILAPVGVRDLSIHVHATRKPEISELPIFLAPGIKTGSAIEGRTQLAQIDVLRGEETLCFGLLARNQLQPGGTLLNLGSHWKAISIGRDAQITSSSTTLSGELVHALQVNTILASALPQEKIGNPDLDWVDAGMAEQKKSGLARAFFCVRLLEMDGRTTPEQRMSFLIGAYIASDLEPWLSCHILEGPVLIAGSDGLACAWAHALQLRAIKPTLSSLENTEAAFLEGLQAICGPPIAQMEELQSSQSPVHTENS